MAKVIGNIITTLMLSSILLCSTALQAEEEDRQGWYGGLSLGLVKGDELKTRTTGDDVPTNFDQFLPGAFPLTDPSYTRGGDGWINSFNIESGRIGSIIVGYGWHKFRFEAEYFYRHQGSGDHSPLLFTRGNKASEFIEASESLNNIKGDNIFLNSYYDFHLSESKMLPYLGIGIGWAHNSMNYSAVFVRNQSRDVLADLGRNPNAAGTASLVNTRELSDSTFGYQFFVGLDYPLGARLYIGMKARYVSYFSDFSGGGRWDLLRSHESTIGPGGGEVVYKVETDNFDFCSVGLQLTLFF